MTTLIRHLTDSVTIQSVHPGASNGTGTIRGLVGESRRHLARSDGTVSVYQCLQDAQCAASFYEYCVKRQMAENMRFWIDVEAFQNQDWKPARVMGFACQGGTMTEQAQQIWMQYFDETAPQQVCVPDQVERSLRERLQDVQQHERDMFREAQRCIMKDLDTCFKEYFEGRSKHQQRGIVSRLQHLDHPNCVTANVMDNQQAYQPVVPMEQYKWGGIERERSRVSDGTKQ